MTLKQPGGSESLMIDFSSSSSAAIIAFGSLHIGQKTIPFEWTNVLESLPAKRIFARDLHQLWYQKGLPGIADSPDGVSDYLHQLIMHHDVEKVVTIGGSMGGYAAMLFGYLLAANEVHAFSGQTYLPTRKGRMLFKAFLQRKWSVLWKNWELVSSRDVNRKYFDLRPLLMIEDRATQYHMYFADNNSKDIAHASHVGDLANVLLHMRPDEGHHVAKAMRKTGELEAILRKSIQPDE